MFVCTIYALSAAHINMTQTGIINFLSQTPCSHPATLGLPNLACCLCVMVPQGFRGVAGVKGQSGPLQILARNTTPLYTLFHNYFMKVCWISSMSGPLPQSRCERE